jgi:hypothetical protein
MASEIKVNTIKDLGGNTVLTSNGSGTITGLPASAISSGTVATARLGSGTASSSTFLAGDSSYKTVSGTTINSNADNRVITGSGTANTLEGEAKLLFDGTTLKNLNSSSGGTANSEANLLVLETSGTNGMSIMGGTSGNAIIAFGDSDDNDVGRIGYDFGNNIMDFKVNAAERMRITSEGKVGIGKTSSIRGFDVHSAQANNFMSEFANTSNDRPHGIFIEYTAASVNTDAEKFILCADQSATRFNVNSNGNVQNSNNSYGGISDTRLKENITDAKSQWNDIKKIKFKNFNLINETTTQLGVIAQDLEADGMNGLVSNSAANKHQIAINSEFGTLEDDTDNPNEDGTFPKKIKENLADVKAVKYSVLLLKSAKALQEAMEKIETLEAKVTALENA